MNFAQSDVRGRILRRMPVFTPVLWALYAVIVGFLVLPASPAWPRLALLGAAGVVALLLNRSIKLRFHLSSTGRLAQCYKKQLFPHDSTRGLKGTLSDLRGAADVLTGKTANTRPPATYLLATDLATMRPCAFSGDGYHFDLTNKQRPKHESSEDTSLALAVAASSAFPGFFIPIPCCQALLGGPRDNELATSVRPVADGGIRDNLALRSAQEYGPTNNLIVASDASATARWTGMPLPPRLVTVPLRATDVLMHRLHATEIEYLTMARMPGAPVMIAMARDDSAPAHPAYGTLTPGIRDALSDLRTDLDRFSDVEIRRLVQHGYCSARETLAARGMISDASPPGAGVDRRSAEPWTPVGVRSARSGHNEQRHIRRGAKRSYVLTMSTMTDAYTWAYAIGLAILIVYLTGIVRQPALERPPVVTASEHELLAWLNRRASLRRSALLDTLASREVRRSGVPVGYAGEHGDKPAETWTTATAACAILQCPEAVRPQKAVLLDVLERRFELAPPGVEDQHPGLDFRNNGWISHYSGKRVHSAPLYWMLAALGTIRRQAGSNNDTITRVDALVKRAWDFTQWHYRRDSWSLLPEDEPAPFPTSLALLAFVHMPSEHGQDCPCTGPQRLVYMRDAGKALLAAFMSNPPGWWAGEPAASLEPADQALSLQVLVSLILANRALKDGGAEALTLTDDMLSVWRHAALNPGDRWKWSLRKYASGFNIRHLVRPWQMMLRVFYYERLKDSTLAVDAAERRRILEFLIGDLDADPRTVATTNDGPPLTFEIAEELFALNHVRF